MSKLIPLREMTIEQQQELSDIMGCNWVDVFCRPEDFAFEWSVGGSVETEIFSLPLSRILKAIQFFEENQIDYETPALKAHSFRGGMKTQTDASRYAI